MEIDVRGVHAELRARRAEIQRMLDSGEQVDTRRLLRLIASLDYHQQLIFFEIAPEPNGPRSLARSMLRQPPGAAAFYLIAGLIGWAIAKGYIKVQQVLSWIAGGGP